MAYWRKGLFRVISQNARATTASSPFHPGGWWSWECRSTSRVWHPLGQVIRPRASVGPADAAGAGAGGGERAHPLSRGELEAELAQQVKIPEPELGGDRRPDPARFDLLDGTVELDGRPLEGRMSRGGKGALPWAGGSGNHVLTALFVYRGSKTGAYRGAARSLPWCRARWSSRRSGASGRRHLRVEVQEEQEDSAQPARVPRGPGAGDDGQGGRFADAASAAQGDPRGAVQLALTAPLASVPRTPPAPT